MTNAHRPYFLPSQPPSQHRGQHRNARPNQRTPLPSQPNSTAILAQPKRQPLRTKRNILLHTRIQALPTLDIEIRQVIRRDEEHVRVLVQSLEARRIIREMITAVRRARVPEEDALHLSWKLGRHLGIGFHDVGIRRVSHEDELASREGLEDLLE